MSAAPGYCCYGCSFAAAVTRSRGEEGAAAWTLARLGMALFLSMNVMVFTMALWTQDLYPAEESGVLATSLRGVFRYLSLLFSLPVLLLLGGPLWESALMGLRRGQRSTDLLLMIGVVASYLYSAVSVIRDVGPVYFEVGCAVLVLVTLGRWLEATGKLRTTSALESLHKLIPDQTRRLVAEGETLVATSKIVVGDKIRVLAGERLPCDGRVLRHTANVDEQALTGESHPVLKKPGDPVHGGTLDLDGDLVVAVTAPSSGGALARLIELTRLARLARGRYERLAERLSAWFLPLVALLAMASGIFHGTINGIDQGVLSALAVLLIACPCALGLATPMAVWAALGEAARVGVLFRHGEALERLAGIRALRLDKTGTLTTGTPRVERCVVAAGTDPLEVQRVAACLARSSHHAHGHALRHYLIAEEIEGLSETRTYPGRGVRGLRCPGEGEVFLGSPRWLEECGYHWESSLRSAMELAHKEGRPLTCLGWGGCVRAVFVLGEELRPEARTAVNQLRALGLNVGVLTGDHASRGRLLEEELGLPVQSEQLPEDKVASLAETRIRFGPVAMVGDGINDAPALAASDVGIALGCGADVSRESASVCLLGNDLTQLPWAIELARRTVRVIRGNLFWAFLYNGVGVAFACTGHLNPVLASLAMVLSSLFVVTNSLRLRHPASYPSEVPEREGMSKVSRQDLQPQETAVASEAMP